MNLFRMVLKKEKSTNEKYTTTDNAISSSIHFISIFLYIDIRLNFVVLQFWKYF